ncbi:hypothetical protein KSP39_PZI014956 [Platanthera zijinensis]|uniref:Myb/SANT-like DNA-binding domain-containing protein n=1 Tax=Platanthera zijinensis TaxID=2320716 RepID=A0AAP0BAW9_9ASPA
MASPSPASSSAAGDDRPASPFAALPPPPPPPPPSSRRLPPPCWSHDETLALINAYRDKWYSLNRGNLRAHHWDSVASSVSNDCPSSSAAPKTSVQCRHKVEKLRKRYRTEKQRSLSSWLYFRKMDAMERGAASTPPASRGISVNGRAAAAAEAAASESGLRFTIPKAVRSKIAGFRPGPKDALKPGLEEMRRRVEEKRRRIKRERERNDDDGAGDLAAALGVLGDGFLRMEQMKMEMSREVEKMRMEMELKRTEMILDCQRQIAEAMVQRFTGK